MHNGTADHVGTARAALSLRPTALHGDSGQQYCLAAADGTRTADILRMVQIRQHLHAAARQDDTIRSIHEPMELSIDEPLELFTHETMEPFIHEPMGAVYS